jgi:hypothetical protein
LLDRLEDFDLNVLAFVIFEEVPFTNNGAQQAILGQLFLPGTPSAGPWARRGWLWGRLCLRHKHPRW